MSANLIDIIENDSPKLMLSRLIDILNLDSKVKVEKQPLDPAFYENDNSFHQSNAFFNETLNSFIKLTQVYNLKVNKCIFFKEKLSQKVMNIL